MKQTPALIVAVLLALVAEPATASNHKGSKGRQSEQPAEVRGADGSGQVAQGERQRAEVGTPEARSRQAEGDADRARERESARIESEAGKRGDELGEEMRTRRDERKAIQEEYRGEREPGQERQDEQDGKPAKKPWWKFWDD